LGSGGTAPFQSGNGKADDIPPNLGEDPARQPPSRVIGAGTFMRTYAPISYTIDGQLPSGFLTFAQILTLAVSMNRPNIIGAEVEPGRVAYVTLENPIDFKMKLAVGCHVHNITFNDIEPRLAIIEGRDTPEQIIDGLRLDAEANGSFQHVNIDTLQAGFAAAGGGKFNDNEAILSYVMRLRALTGLPGQPSVLVLCHPTKNATEDDLQPYGGGATVNELDGNLTLWKASQIKLHHTDKLRGPTFEPKYFRIEKCSCPDIVDNKGRQILLPVMRPITETDAEERKTQEGNVELALLKTMIENEEGTQRDWAFKIGKGQSSVGFLLKKLEKDKYVSASFGKWHITTKGRNAVEK
jgi:hypothetical protein